MIRLNIAARRSIVAKHAVLVVPVCRFGDGHMGQDAIGTGLHAIAGWLDILGRAGRIDTG